MFVLPGGPNRADKFLRGGAQRLGEFEDGGDGRLFCSGFEFLNVAQRGIGDLGQLFLGEVFFGPVLPKVLAKYFRNHTIIHYAL